MRPLLLLLLVGCGSSTTSEPTMPKKKSEAAREEAAAGARAVLTEGYGSIRRGDIDGLQALATADVFVLGPGSGNVFVSRTDVVVGLASALKHGEKHQVSSRALQVVASPGAKAAWAIDRLDIDGTPYHLSALLVETDEIWQIAAIHVGEATGVPDKRPPKPAALPGGIAPGAEEMVARYKLVVADPEKLVDQLAERKEVVDLGVSTKEIARGLKAIKKTWKKKLKRHPKLVPNGEVRAALSPDGGLGYVLANLDYEDDSTDKHRRRYTFIYERTKKGWELVAVHGSIGTP